MCGVCPLVALLKWLRRFFQRQLHPPLGKWRTMLPCPSCDSPSTHWVVVGREHLHMLVLWNQFQQYPIDLKIRTTPSFGYSIGCSSFHWFEEVVGAACCWKPLNLLEQGCDTALMECFATTLLELKFSYSACTKVAFNKYSGLGFVY